jgi:hypothetical protein
MTNERDAGGWIPTFYSEYFVMKGGLEAAAAGSGNIKSVRIQARLKQLHEVVLASPDLDPSIVRPAKGYIEIEHKCGTCAGQTSLTTVARVVKDGFTCAKPDSSSLYQCVISEDKVCITFFNYQDWELVAVRFVYKMPVPPFGVSLAEQGQCVKKFSDLGDVCIINKPGIGEESTAEALNMCDRSENTKECVPILSGSIELHYFTIRYFDDCSKVKTTDESKDWDAHSDICARCPTAPTTSAAPVVTPSPNSAKNGLMGLRGESCECH